MFTILMVHQLRSWMFDRNCATFYCWFGGRCKRADAKTFAAFFVATIERHWFVAAVPEDARVFHCDAGYGGAQT
ncbi:MAG: hypothetical protein U5R49_06170 [Deltaproteobacteria bacterium]|nr:hypothetical protein [Deltaproteobacteria bacterium]